MKKIKILALLLAAVILLSSSNVFLSASAASEETDEEFYISEDVETPCNAPYSSSAVSSNSVRYVWYVKPKIVADDMKAFFNRNGSGKLDKMNMLQCIPFKKNGKWGLVDYSGKVVCNAVYDDIQVNSVGAMVGIDNNNFGNYKVLVYSNGKIKTKEYMFELGTNGRSTRDFYWDETTKKLYLQDGAARAEFSTSNDLTAAQIGEKIYFGSSNYFMFSSPNGLPVNKNNPDIVLVANQKRVNNTKYVDGGCASNGLIAMRIKDKWGYLNSSGKTIIPFEYNATSLLPYESYDRIHSVSVERYVPFEATNGYVSLCKNGKYSLYNTNGKVVILEGTFDKILPVYSKSGKKLAWVKSNGKWGIISVTDKPIDLTHDVDGDGSITSADALIVLRMSVGLVKVTNSLRTKADADKDGKITSSDSLYILRMSVGIT